MLNIAWLLPLHYSHWVITVLYGKQCNVLAPNELLSLQFAMQSLIFITQTVAAHCSFVMITNYCNIFLDNKKNHPLLYSLGGAPLPLLFAAPVFKGLKVSNYAPFLD